MPISSQANNLCKCGEPISCKGRCKKCYGAHRYRTDTGAREQIKGRSRISNAAKWRHWRDELFAIKGSRCVRCGFDDKRALQVDHVNGGGNRMAKSLTPSEHHKWKMTHLDEIQVLCANCNWIKKSENGEYGSGRPARIGSKELEGSETRDSKRTAEIPTSAEHSG